MLRFKLNKKVRKDKMKQWLASKPLAAESYEKALQDNRKVIFCSLALSPHPHLTTQRAFKSGSKTLFS